MTRSNRPHDSSTRGVRRVLSLLAVAAVVAIPAPGAEASGLGGQAAPTRAGMAVQQSEVRALERLLAAETLTSLPGDVVAAGVQELLEAARAQSETERELHQRVRSSLELTRLELEQARARMFADQGVAAAGAQAEYALAIAQERTAGTVDATRAKLLAEQAWTAQSGALGGSREQLLYARGKSLLDRSRWAEAIETFDSVIQMKGQKTDGALYWKAYAQNRLGQRAEALTTLQDLQKTYPKSAWLTDARALEMEVRQVVGQPVRPEAETDEDIKLIAISVLIQSDPERSIPMLEKVLQGSSSPRLKSRALFVLAQSNTPKSREILSRVAKGGMNPDLQMDAMKYLGIHGGTENRQLLSDIYGATGDVEVKRQVLRSFGMAGEKDRLLEVAKTEKSFELRAEAVRQLGMVKGGQEELFKLYRADLAPEVRQQIISAMIASHSTDRLLDIAKTEKDAKLRALAIRNLGMVSGYRVFSETAGAAGWVAGGVADAAAAPRQQRVVSPADAEAAAKISQELVAIYKSDKEPDVRKAVVTALYVQHNAKTLVDLARAETDPALKRELVQRLSTMKSKEATDYLMELLVK